VRRDEIDSTSSSRESSIDIDAVERFRTSVLFTDEHTNDVDTPDAGDDEHPGEAEDEIAFRLFAPTSARAEDSVTQTVRIRSPTPQDVEPGLLDASRPSAYYFTGPTPAAVLKEYEEVTVSGADIIARSKGYWPGCAYKWRTITIPASQAATALCSASTFMKLVPETAEARRRGRVGKKSRIKKRKLFEAKTTKAQAKDAKERAEREKKAKRNRDKKLKKRERDKVKKLATEEQSEVRASEDAGTREEAGESDT